MYLVLGVGRTLTSQLHGMGIFTCGDLQKLSQAALSDMFKGSGALLFRFVLSENHAITIVPYLLEKLPYTLNFIQA